MKLIEVIAGVNTPAETVDKSEKFKDTDELVLFLKELLKTDCVERTYTQTVLNVVKEDMGSANIL